MAYVECKIWPFSDDINGLEERNKAMREGHAYQAVSALIDTTSDENFISERIVERLGIDYFKHASKGSREAFGTIFDLDISFRYKGKDGLVSKSDTDYTNFEVAKGPYLKADLVIGLPWLWLHEAKIDIRKNGIRIYDKFVPFCEDDSVPKGCTSQRRQGKGARRKISEKTTKILKRLEDLDNRVDTLFS